MCPLTEKPLLCLVGILLILPSITLYNYNNLESGKTSMDTPLWNHRNLEIQSNTASNFTSSPSFKTIYNAHIKTLEYNGPRRCIATSGKYIFLGYVWNNGSYKQLSVIASEDLGRTWSSPIDIWRGTPDNILYHLYVWKDELFVFYVPFYSSYSSRGLYEKHAPISSWRNLRTATQNTIMSTYAAIFDVASDNNYLYVAAKKASYLYGQLYRYDGNNWRLASTPVSYGQCGTLAIAAVRESTYTRILYFYANTGNYLSVKTSTNGGSTWSTSVVMNDYTDYYRMQALNINGTVLIFANHYYRDDIDMALSKDKGRTWSNEVTLVANRGTTSYGHMGTSFTAGVLYNSSEIALAYEGSNNKIQYIYSTDWGANWVSETQKIIVDNNTSFNPLISDSKGLLVYSVPNSTNVDLKVKAIGRPMISEIKLVPHFQYINVTWSKTNGTLANGYMIFKGNNTWDLRFCAQVDHKTWFRDYSELYNMSRRTPIYYCVIGFYENWSLIAFSNVTKLQNRLPLIENLSAKSGYLYVNLSWDPIDRSLGYNITDYVVYRGKSPESLQRFARCGEATWYNDTFRNITYDTFYYGVTYILNDSIESPLSELIEARPLMPPAIQNLTAIPGIFNVTLKWEPLPANIYSLFNITSFNIYRSKVINERSEFLCDGGGKDVAARYKTPRKPSDKLYIQNRDGVIYSFDNASGDTISLGPYPGSTIVLRIVNHSNELINMTFDAILSSEGGSPTSIQTSFILYGGNNSSINKALIIEPSKTFYISTENYTPLQWYSIYIPSEEYYLFIVLNSTIRDFYGRYHYIAFDRYIIEFSGTLPRRNLIATIANATLYVDCENELKSFNKTFYYYSVTYSIEELGEVPPPEFVKASPIRPEPILSINGSRDFFSFNISWKKPEKNITDLYPISSFHLYRKVANLTYATHEGSGVPIGIRISGATDGKYLVDGDGLICRKPPSQQIGSVSIGYLIFNLSGHEGEMCDLFLSTYIDALAPKERCVMSFALYGGVHTYELRWIGPRNYIFEVSKNGTVVRFENLSIPYDTYYIKIEITNAEYKYVFDNYTISFCKPYEKIGTTSQCWMEDETDFIRNFAPLRVAYHVSYSLSGVFGESDPSPDYTATLLVPPPVVIKDVSPRNFSVFLSWDPPSINQTGNYQVQEYLLYRGKTPDTLKKVLVIKNATHCTVQESSKERKTYYYALRYALKDVKGTSSFSNIVAVKPYTTPQQPMNVAAFQRGFGIQLLWDAPEDDGGYNITGYIVYRGLSPDELFQIAILSPYTNVYYDRNVSLGIPYYYAIAGMNGLGVGLRSEIAVGKVSYTPSQPEGFAAIGGNGQIVLYWAEPAMKWGEPVINYNLYRGSSVDNITFYINFTGDTYSFIDIVDNGKVYYYMITAENKYGEGESAGPVWAKAIGPPGAVVDFSVVPGDGMNKLTWYGVVDDGGAEILGYNIYRSLNETAMTLLGTVSSVCRVFYDLNLINGQTYYYWISAVNEAGEGEVAGPEMGIPGRPPDAINNVTATGALHKITLRWEHPAISTYKISSYRIYRGESPTSLKPYKIINETLTTFVDADLPGEMTYYYAISAVNYFGEGALSPIIFALSYGEPSPIRELKADPGKTWITLTWKEPERDGGSPVLKYKVFWRGQGISEWESDETTETEFSIESLRHGRYYAVKVIAVTSYAESDPVEISNIPVGGIPSPPVFVEVVKEKDGVILRWREPENVDFHIIKYRIYVSIGEGSLTFCGETSGDLRTFKFTNILYGERYVFRVSAVNIIGESELSTAMEYVARTVPGQISKVWVSIEDNEIVVIGWEEPLFNGGTQITRFRIYRGEVAGEEQYYATVKDVLEYRDESVENGKTYYYRISAINDVGEGPLSLRIKATPMGYPSAPVKLHAIVKSDCVTLFWDEPENNGGGSIIGYAVYRGRVGGEMKLIARVDENVRSFEDRSMSPGKRYIYRVAAINLKGEGETEDIIVEVPGRLGIGILLALVGAGIPLAIILYSLILVPKRHRDKSRTEETKIPEAARLEKPVLPSPEAPKKPALPPHTPIVHIQPPPLTSSITPPAPPGQEVLYYRPEQNEAVKLSSEESTSSENG